MEFVQETSVDQGEVLVTPTQAPERLAISAWRKTKDRPMGLVGFFFDELKHTPWWTILYRLGLLGFTVTGFFLPQTPLITTLRFIAVSGLISSKKQELARYYSRLREARQELLDPVAPIPQQLVFVKFNCGLCTYGEDMGVAWLSDGIFTFQGMRTHFAVTSEYAEYDSVGLSNFMLVTGEGAAGALKIKWKVEDKTYVATVSWIPKYEEDRILAYHDWKLAQGKAPTWIDIGLGPYVARMAKPFRWMAYALRGLKQKLFSGESPRQNVSVDAESRAEWKSWAKDKVPASGLVVLPPIEPGPESFAVLARDKWSAMGWSLISPIYGLVFISSDLATETPLIAWCGYVLILCGAVTFFSMAMLTWLAKKGFVEVQERARRVLGEYQAIR